MLGSGSVFSKNALNREVRLVIQESRYARASRSRSGIKPLGRTRKPHSVDFPTSRDNVAPPGAKPYSIAKPQIESCCDDRDDRPMHLVEQVRPSAANDVSTHNTPYVKARTLWLAYACCVEHHGHYTGGLSRLQNWLVPRRNKQYLVTPLFLRAFSQYAAGTH